MQKYTVRLEGITPLMMHRDNLEFKEILKKWQQDPANRNKSVPGDDRSPAWTWIGSLYHDGVEVAIPTDCIMASCMGGGAEVKVGRGAKTFKGQTQSGMAFEQPFLPLCSNGDKPVQVAHLQGLQRNEDFAEHLEVARALGFALDVRRAKPPGANSKHVRVRPLFEHWAASGVLNVWDDSLKKDILETIFYQAGDRHGLLEWRPSARRPGPFGRFRAVLSVVH